MVVAFPSHTYFLRFECHYPRNQYAIWPHKIRWLWIYECISQNLLTSWSESRQRALSLMSAKLIPHPHFHARTYTDQIYYMCIEDNSKTQNSRSSLFTIVLFEFDANNWAAFVWFDSVPSSQQFFSYDWQVFLGWTSAKRILTCLAQGHNTVMPLRLEPLAPRSPVKHSITEPLCSLDWALTWDFQQCGMYDQQTLRSACAYALSDQNLC